MGKGVLGVGGWDYLQTAVGIKRWTWSMQKSMVRRGRAGAEASRFIAWAQSASSVTNRAKA